jgi:hypothetical protein
LYVTGTGTVLFVGDRTIDSFITGNGAYITIKNQDGNTTINHYYGNSSRNTWTSGEGNYFILALTFETDYYEYLEDALLIFADDSNQTSTSYWNFIRSTVYSRGHFLHNGQTFYFEDDNSTFINQGFFECTSSFSGYSSSADGIGAFISVGVVKFVNGATFNVHTAVCNGGLLILADSEDNYFDSVYVTTTERVAFDGSLELEFGSTVPEDYELTNTNLWYWYSGVAKYPDEYDEDGIPNTFNDDQSDYDVRVRESEDGDVEVYDYSDVEPCWTNYGLYGYSDEDERDANILCKDQPDMADESLCTERELPEATVEIDNNIIARGSASNMIFSVLSVFLTADFLTLF